MRRKILKKKSFQLLLLLSLENLFGGSLLSLLLLSELLLELDVLVGNDLGLCGLYNTKGEERGERRSE